MGVAGWSWASIPQCRECLGVAGWSWASIPTATNAVNAWVLGAGPGLRSRLPPMCCWVVLASIPWDPPPTAVNAMNAWVLGGSPEPRCRRRPIVVAPSSSPRSSLRRRRCAVVVGPPLASSRATSSISPATVRQLTSYLPSLARRRTALCLLAVWWVWFTLWLLLERHN